MKHLDNMQEGGYPFDDISIDYLQQMHNDRDSFIASAFGDFKIVKGVVLNSESNTYSDGLITVNGKLYHFVGGAFNNAISKRVIETKRFYEDGTEKKAFINEFYEFGDAGTDVTNFWFLKRWFNNQPIYKEIKYIGASVDNAELPLGWFIADGENGTDDLRSRFIVGQDNRDTDYNSVGKTGGSKKHQLSESEMPRHKHSSSNVFNKFSAIASDYGNNSSSSNATDGGNSANEELAIGNLTPSAINSMSEIEKGDNQPHENRPPYYVMIIIQFVGI